MDIGDRRVEPDHDDSRAAEPPAEGADDAALEGARVWKGTQPPEFYVDDWSDPAEMQRKAADEISDEEFKQSYIVSSDPAVHVERIREIEAMGATVVCLQNASGADPRGAIETYREHVLPALRRS